MSDMRRREFTALVGGVGLLLAVKVRRARAQQPSKIPRIGILDDAPMWQAFRQALRELGYVEGQNIAYEYRYGEGAPDRLMAVAAELVRSPVDLISTYGTLLRRDEDCGVGREHGAHSGGGPRCWRLRPRLRRDHARAARRHLGEQRSVPPTSHRPHHRVPGDEPVAGDVPVERERGGRWFHRVRAEPSRPVRARRRLRA